MAPPIKAELLINFEEIRLKVEKSIKNTPPLLTARLLIAIIF